MPLATVEKSPGATLPYTINWAPWLNGADTLFAVTWTVPTGITSVSESNTTLKASITLSGGTAGAVYDVKCSITSTGGLIDSRTLRFIIVDR